MMNRPSVSVIIPVYNAENYIERCCRSLFEQTLESLEFVFVNDCTPDNSFEILSKVLEDYPQRHQQVRIIEMKSNSRQAAARNAGIEVASGKYQIHCDPDDWVEPEFYECLFDYAERYHAGIVTSDYTAEYSDGNNKYVHTGRYSHPMDILKSRRFYFFALWNHLVRSDIIRENRIRFYDSIDYMEDFGFLARVVFYAKTIGHLNKAFYHYNKANEGAITRRGSSPGIMRQRIACMGLLDEFFRTRGIEPFSLDLLMLTKRDIKDIYLSTGDFKTWRRTFPEVAKWEFHNGKAGLAYRTAYLLSNKVIPPMMQIYIAAKRFCKAMK